VREGRGVKASAFPYAFIHPTSGDTRSRKFAVASSPARPRSKGYRSGPMPLLARSKGARVACAARFPIKRLRLATSGPRENFVG
jgi:hypothetical protein